MTQSCIYSEIRLIYIVYEPVLRKRCDKLGFELWARQELTVSYLPLKRLYARSLLASAFSVVYNSFTGSTTRAKKYKFPSLNKRKKT